ncbi:hypothetical protein ABPG75_003262 [Micractinium tetrahymenae]
MQPVMASAQDRLKLLARSWTMVAEGYDKSFSGRFGPWQRDAIAQLQAALPASGRGTIAVPACGPGQELPLLAAAFPRHRIVGIDLAEGMVEVARRLVAERGLADRVEVRAGDASRLDGLGPLAGVLSVFGLQQMPAPGQVLANWVAALQPGGACCVCFWPQQVERAGPWQRLFDLTAALNRQPQPDWEAGIPGQALAAINGVQLLRDERVVHAMEWPSAAAFWQAMTRAGPWHSRLLHFGEEHMEELRKLFMEGYPDEAAPLAHTPEARLVCLRRGPAPKAAL